ncbi:uncharacterized protein LOC130636764 [Hydractinia symbiolongicarpus]|uniref:uncharacterized protein LOC130636764 n=1 Tax=Hydractinia symbiolongicarpus TaxID=13093 RepID=UPI00254EF60A|nr:uncharacterized protein LOC130636764 [Hydractinia symbiolongicarpus]
MVNITLTPNATGYASNLTVVQNNIRRKADFSQNSTYIIFASCGIVFILCILLTIIIKVRRSQQRRQTSKDHETAINITQTKVEHASQQSPSNHEDENDLEITSTNRNIKGKLPVNTAEPVNIEEPQYEISVSYKDTVYCNIPAHESNEVTQNCRQTSKIGRYYESLRRFTPFGKNLKSKDSHKYASVKCNMFLKSKKKKFWIIFTCHQRQTHLIRVIQI